MNYNISLRFFICDFICIFICDQIYASPFFHSFTIFFPYFIITMSQVLDTFILNGRRSLSMTLISDL